MERGRVGRQRADVSINSSALIIGNPLEIKPPPPGSNLVSSAWFVLIVPGKPRIASYKAIKVQKTFPIGLLVPNRFLNATVSTPLVPFLFCMLLVQHMYVVIAT
jgi:hypothetical protein